MFDHVVPGQYVSALSIFSAGSSVAWVASQICGDLKARAQAEETDVYRLIDEEASTSPPGSHGVLFNPSLASGNALDLSPNVRGAFLNLDLRHTRSDLLRATLEGVALGLRNDVRAPTDVNLPNQESAQQYDRVFVRYKKAAEALATWAQTERVSSP